MFVCSFWKKGSLQLPLNFASQALSGQIAELKVLYIIVSNTHNGLRSQTMSLYVLVQNFALGSSCPVFSGVISVLPAGYYAS